MTITPHFVSVQQPTTPGATLAETHAALFTAQAGAVHAAPQPGVRPFQIFSLYDAATPVVYTNHTR